MADSLLVNEIFLSIQGESSYAGWACVFLRLTGCNLRCSYCDTAYAFDEGQRLGIDEVVFKILALAEAYTHKTAFQPLPIVELTGGEPLLQPGALDLMSILCDKGFTVLLETNGSLDIGPVDERVHRIVDIKCPSSGEQHRILWENIGKLTAQDEVKFVIASHEDYEWARQVVTERALHRICLVLFSWASPLEPSQRDPSLRSVPPGHRPITRRELAERIVADAMCVRLHLQLHKFIWPADKRGV